MTSAPGRAYHKLEINERESLVYLTCRNRAVLLHYLHPIQLAGKLTVTSVLVGERLVPDGLVREQDPRMEDVEGVHGEDDHRSVKDVCWDIT
jgi:hypothetical protein